jgi:branched-chain amino acid transport system ATP-binding protein
MSDPELFERLPALEPLRDRRAGLLSGGEQQMLAIARAIVARPRLLVVDELSTGMAPATTDLLLRLLRELADHDGMGVLVVEQHVHRVLAVADRGVLLRRGRVVLSGTAAELTDRIDEVEAGYLGD